MTAEPPHASLPNLSDKLRLAASKGQIDKVQELVQSGASFQPDKDGRSALHYAALNGYSEVCKYLISQQCPLDIQDASGFTALHRAASQGHMEVIRCLLEEGCAIDRQDEHGNAALHEASWNGFSSALELLIKHSCNVVVTNKAGFTALHLSAQNGHNQSTRVLLYGGCNPDLKNNYGDTALHTAARYGHAGVTRILISARCCLNEQNKNGDTALHIASALKRRKIAKLLVEAKIDVYITNKQNETAIDVARRKEHPEIIVIITTMSRSKTPKASQQSRLHPQPQKEVNFKEVPVDIVDGPMVVPDVPVKSDKSHKEKSMFSFFKKKKPKQEKEKGIELVTMASSAGQKDGEKSVKGFFSQYVPRPGNQYYRDLAGNIKQGPIGYTPICHCGPALHRLEQQLHTDHDNIYQHMDASNKVLHNRIDQLDKRTAQQVFAIDKLTKERLMQEEQGCHNRINRRFEEERVYNNNNFQGQMEQFLEAKLAAYGHCLDHHHDDSALPNNNIFTDIHETANGRLFKSRSDETLSQSDYSGKFRKKQFYESRQAAMQQMRAWQVPNVNKVRENRKPEKFPQAKTMSQGQIYSKQGQIAIGQIQVHSAPMREREEARVAVNGSQYDMLSPSTASTSGRTPNVLSPMDSVNTRQDFSGQGAIPKRLIPHSQTWHNSQQFRDNSIQRDPSPLNHSTPKSRDSSPYEVMHAVTRPGSGGMVRSHTDNEGLHRATRQRQSFPERGSSNTSTGTNQTSNSSGAGQGPQANQEQSSTKTGEGGGKYYENKPTFTTFGYPDNMEPRSPSQERTHDNGEGVVVDNNDSKPVQPRPGSSLREESPYGPFPVKPEVPRKPEVSRKPGFQEQNVSRTNNNVKENGSQYGYFVHNKDDMYLSMQQQRPVSVRQRTRSSDELLLDELELTSAHDMAKGHRSRLQQNYTEGRNNDYVRPQVNQGHNGQGQRYASQGQWPNHGQNDLAYQRPTSTRQSDQGQGRYFSVNGRSQAQPENRFSTVKGDPRYGSRDGSRTPVENQYVSSRDVSQYHIDSAHYNSPVKQGAPYHSTYYVNRAGQSGDQHISMDGSDKNISLSKSESNLMERTSDNSASHNFTCNTPVTGVEDSPRSKDIRSVANYPNAYAKEDSSSNPDSGYSSKIFGNRLHPGPPRSNSGTPSFNSTSPSFNSGTPSSSFSADHSMSTPGQSHTNSPSVLVTNPDYEQIPASRDQYNQSLKSHVNNWYQRQLQESAHRLHDGIYVGSPQKQYHAQSSSQTSGKPLQGTSKSHHLPHYEQTPPPQQYGNQSYSSSQGYHGNQSYANYQHVSSFVRGSDV